MQSKEFRCPGGACIPHAPLRSTNEIFRVMCNYGQNIHTSTHGWGSLHRCQNLETESIRSWFIQFLVILPDPTH